MQNVELYTYIRTFNFRKKLLRFWGHWNLEGLTLLITIRFWRLVSGLIASDTDGMGSNEILAHNLAFACNLICFKYYFFPYRAHLCGSPFRNYLIIWIWSPGENGIFTYTDRASFNFQAYRKSCPNQYFNVMNRNKIIFKLILLVYNLKTQSITMELINSKEFKS